MRSIRLWLLTDGAVSDNVADRSADPLLRIPVIPADLKRSEKEKNPQLGCKPRPVKR